MLLRHYHNMQFIGGFGVVEDHHLIGFVNDVEVDFFWDDEITIDIVARIGCHAVSLTEIQFNGLRVFMSESSHRMPERLAIAEVALRDGVDSMLQAHSAVEIEGMTSVYFRFDDLDSDIQWSAEFGSVTTEVLVERSRNFMARPDVRVTSNTSYLDREREYLCVTGETALLKGRSGKREYQRGTFVYDDDCNDPSATAIMLPGPAISASKKTARAVPFIKGGGKSPARFEDSKARIVLGSKEARKWLRQVEEGYSRLDQMSIIEFCRGQLADVSEHEPKHVSGRVTK